MNLTGRYSIIKRDKNHKIVDKITKYNKITNTGKSVMMQLFKKSTHIDDFHNMVGYKFLDLSPYYLKPIFANQQTTYQDDQNEPNYITNFQFEDTEHPNMWKVESSLFFTADSLRLPDNVYVNNADNYYFNPHSYDSHLLNDSSNLRQNVDNILLKNNTTNMIWSGCYSSNNYNDGIYLGHKLKYNTHNIDFFRVKCTQKIILYKNDITVPLWNGNHFDKDNVEHIFLTPNVIFKCNYNRTQNKQFIFKYRPYNSNSSYTQLTSNYTINNDMTVSINYSNFPNTRDVTNAIQIIMQYYVYYKDQQLKNGICGMYLNYNLSYDNQGYGSALYEGRMAFGNGKFSYNGGISWDSYISYPWQGRPVPNLTISANPSYYSTFEWFWRYYYNNRDVSRHMFFTTSQMKDANIWDHYYSFYPFVTNTPTNFMFHIYLASCQLSMKNFMFLVPDFTVSTPRVFTFGTSDIPVSQNDQSLGDQRIRLDALECYLQDQNADQNGYLQEQSIITWKTYIDYNVGNGVSIKQLGLQCGQVVLEDSSYTNWKYIRPLKKEDCNLLFSRVVLDEPIEKTQQQSLEVLYEIVTQ